MLEQLINLVTEHAQGAVVNNADIPNEKNQPVIQETTNSVLSGLQGILANGGAGDLLSMFTNKNGASSAASGGIMNTLTAGVVSNLVSKLGIDNGIAKNVASSMIPNVLSGLVSKTQDPSDNGFNLNSLMGLLTSGNASDQSGTGGFDFQSIISKAMSGGLDQNHDGSVGLGDVISLVTNSASQNQKQQGQGGFSSLLGNLFK